MRDQLQGIRPLLILATAGLVAAVGCAAPRAPEPAPEPSGAAVLIEPSDLPEDEHFEIHRQRTLKRGPGGPQYEAFDETLESAETVREAPEALQPEAIEIPADRKRKPSKDNRYEIPNSIVICSWNIKWFGLRDVTHYDYVTMADFIEECDAIALQELVEPNHAAVISALLAELSARGFQYGHRVSQNTGYWNNADPGKNDYLERYAFLWNTATVNIKGATRYASLPLINNTTFRQVPYVANFEVIGANGFDFRLLSTHTVYKSQLNAVRAAEIQRIVRWVTTLPSDGEANLIAMGDFNANPNGQPSHFASIVTTDPRYRVAWYESGNAGETSIRTTVPQNNTSSNPTYFNLPLYDHAVISAATTQAMGGDQLTFGANRFGVWEFDNDPWWSANGWSRLETISVVSDHRPIWIRLVRGTADQD